MANYEDKIKKLNDTLLQIKNESAADETINVEDIKLSKIKADEKI